MRTARGDKLKPKQSGSRLIPLNFLPYKVCDANSGGGSFGRGFGAMEHHHVADAHDEVAGGFLGE